MKDIISQKSFNSLFSREPFFNYDPIGGNIVISLPESVLSGTLPLIPIDNNNIGFCNTANSMGAFTFTAGAIAYGEAFKVSNQSCSNMTGRVNLICGEDTDLYGPTSDKWPDPIHITMISSGTGYTYKEYTIQLNKNYDSSWTLTSGSAVMSLEKGALNPNSRGRRGDLNLLALIFIFITAGLKVQLPPKVDRHIRESFKTIISWI